MISVALITLVLAAPATEESVDILGFSRNEKLAAWRVDVAQLRRDGLVDYYSLVEVADARTGEPVGTYRSSRVRRSSLTGPNESIRQSVLMADNPRFAAAQPVAAWSRLRRRAGFRATQVPMDYPSVRLIPDRDQELRGSASHKQMRIESAVGTPIGFTAVAHLETGRNIEVGHFRQSASGPVRVEARVQAHVSPSRRGLILVTTFTIAARGLVLPTNHVATTRLKGRLDLPPDWHDIAQRHEEWRRTQREWETFFMPRPRNQEVDELYDLYFGSPFDYPSGKLNETEDDPESVQDLDFLPYVTSTDFPW